MIEEFISRGDLVFDIGANVGKWTARAMSLGATVIAVEPLPQMREPLEALGATVVIAACGQESGNTKIYMGDWSTHSSLREDWIIPHYEYNKWTTHGSLNVDVITVDQLINQYGEPSFIKIDTEGFEPEVILGMTSAPKALSFEYHGPNYPIVLKDDPSYRAAALINDMAEYEYRCIGGETDEWITPWMNFRGLDEFLRSSNWGDVYARRISGH